jgi:hypothetical protein
MKRCHHRFVRVKRAVITALSEILQALVDPAVQERLGRESDLASLDLGLQKVAHIDADLPPNAPRNDHLELLLNRDDRLAPPVEQFTS